MCFLIDAADVANYLKFAEGGADMSGGIPLDQLFGLHAIADEVGHRDHFEAVLPAELGELRHARHGAVLVHDFANHTAGRKAREPRQIDSRFGLSRANEYAAWPGTQREHVSRTREIWRARRRIHGDANGVSAIVS